MAARSIASLTLSFGLVAIPVKLFSATAQAASMHFHLLHKRDGSRLRQQYVCQKEGVVVPRNEIVKGYEFAKGEYVQFTSEEIKALEETGTRSVDISEFVPLESVDPLYYATTYYLAPDKGGNKPYSLFVTALRDTGRCAVGHWASHGRGHVVVLRPLGNALALHQMHYADEVVPVDELGVEDAKVREGELKLARQLIEQQTAKKFDPRAYRDEVKARIQASIQRKVKGEEISISEERPAGEGKVIDLMQALRASLARKGERAGSAVRALGGTGRAHPGASSGAGASSSSASSDRIPPSRTRRSHTARAPHKKSATAGRRASGR